LFRERKGLAGFTLPTLDHSFFYIRRVLNKTILFVEYISSVLEIGVLPQDVTYHQLIDLSFKMGMVDHIDDEFVQKETSFGRVMIG
jgi:hypothetical protein